MAQSGFRAFAFLDRDGTINEEMDILHKSTNVPLKRPNELVVIPGAIEAIKLLNQHGYCVVIVTNQPQIAKGLSTEEEVNIVNNYLVKKLSENGAKVDAVYYCPHHPDKGHEGENSIYKIVCDCRKPGLKMLRLAEKKFHMKIDEKSFMLGDQTRDIQTGKNAGCKTILVKTGYGGKDGKFDVKADYEVENLLEAVKIVIGNK